MSNQKSLIEMNLIIDKFKCVMFEFKNGRVYWLRQHHRHLDPEDSPRVRVGKWDGAFPKGTRQSNRRPEVRILYNEFNNVK